MHGYFPDEKQAIDEYVNLVFKASQKFYMDKALSPIMSSIFGRKLRNPFYAFSDKTTYEVLSSITKNEELIKVLSGQYGDYGLPPKQSSFVMHAAYCQTLFCWRNYHISNY